MNYNVIVDEEEYTLPSYFPVMCPGCFKVFSVDKQEELIIPEVRTGVMDGSPEEHYTVCPYCGEEVNGFLLPHISDLEEWLGEDELSEIILEGMKTYYDKRKR